MVLVSGATGKTGRHIVASLIERGHAVRALAHSERSRHALEVTGVQDVVMADMLDPSALLRAMDGMHAVVHIGPAMHQKETVMGENMIDAARAAGVSRFVYSSVAHPQIEGLLNHQAKLPVERYLIESRLSYTILQPMRYMQNVSVPEVVEKGVFTLPYSLDVQMSFVDLADVGGCLESAFRERTRTG